MGLQVHVISVVPDGAYGPSFRSIRDGFASGAVGWMGRRRRTWSNARACNHMTIAKCASRDAGVIQEGNFLGNTEYPGGP